MPTAPARTQRPPTILSIDDTPMFQRLIKIALEYQGFKVIEAASGAEGLRLARTNPPDLILLDLMMPVMDGLAVCREIMHDARLKTIPVVMLSSSDDADEMTTCLKEGAANYVLKPFHPSKLVEVVRQQLAS